VSSAIVKCFVILLLGGAYSLEGYSQTPAPDQGVVIDDGLWTSDAHYHWYANTIIASSSSSPLTITADANSELISGTQVHLTENFHAGGFGANGHFRAWIDDAQGTAADLVQITPDPATHVINNVMHVEKWEKLELGLKPPQDFVDAIEHFFANFYYDGVQQTATPSMVDLQHDLNPYADDSLLLVMRLTSPTGVQKMKWGFYMREAEWPDTLDHSMLVENIDGPLSPYPVRFRIAPDEVGTWNFSITVSAPHTTNANGVLPERTFGNYSFVCDPPLPDNHGPLQVNQTNHRNLQFKDSTAFFGLGTNMADVRGTTPGLDWYLYGQRDHKTMLKTMDDLHSVGGNSLRMWLMRNIFAPEWVNAGVYDAFKAVPPPNCGYALTYTGNCQTQCWTFDRMLDAARANEIYIQLALPLGPGGAYETYIWAGDPYVIRFLENNRDTSGLFDVEHYFFTDGDPSNTDSGVFYYWKRKYKYIMSRWGYSVNISSIEPFNEMDGMLTYGVDRNITDSTNIALCPNNFLFWPEDPDLPGTISNWFSSISHFVRDPVNFSDPAHSPLGESDKLFLASFTDGGGPNDAAHYLPFTNPDIDLIDVHKYSYNGEELLRNNFNDSQAYRDNFQSNGQKKPFQNGEVGTWGSIDHDNDTITGNYDTYTVFSNYDVSFHNAIWSSTFFGNFAAGSDWFWNRVFWWPNSLPHGAGPQGIPLDVSNPDQPVHSGILGATNILRVRPDTALLVSVKNQTLYHHFKPLHKLLTNPNWPGFDFFNGNYNPQLVYDNFGKIECYYLQSDDGLMAVGWVHNLNAYWENNYYLTADTQNFLGCAAPTVQLLTIPGFQSGTDYHISWFPTRMDTTIVPENGIDSTGTGSVILDLSTAPLGDTIQYFLDTLRADYAFIISLNPVPKNLTLSPEPTAQSLSWEFNLFPNPTRTEVNIVLPSDDVSKEVVIYDLSGKRIRSFNSNGTQLLQISTEGFAKGPYCVRVSDQKVTRMKTLIIH